MWVRSGPDRLCQTRLIPRSPDGDNNRRMFELLNDEVIKMQHENISTSDLRANESLAFTWSPFRLSRNKCSTWGYSFVCASNE